MGIGDFYINNLKKLQVIPIIILILSLSLLFYNYSSKGQFLEKDITLKGGSVITITTDKSAENIESLLDSRFNADFSIKRLAEFGTSAPKGIVIETNLENVADLKTTLEEFLKIKLTNENFSVEVTSSSLGEAFSSQIITAMIAAFILMAIVIFIVFRVLVPSIAVIFAAVFDILVAMAGMNILGIKLSTATAAALLLLIGYSIDTDILLTTKLLKRKMDNVSLSEKIFESIRTGSTMTFAALAAILVGYIVTSSFIMKDMFLVIIIGLIADLFSTWLVNVYVLKSYIARHEKNG